jgi:precorrin-6Y C5,15-methyltransferase (decarboxylating)
MTPWLTVIGVGDDGLAGLSPAVRVLIGTAEVLVGGDRHQAMVSDSDAERLTWRCGIGSVMNAIAGFRGRRVVVLTTGDPMWFGAGANLARRFPAHEMTVLPHPGAFSLAASRLGWPLADVETLTVHGRPLAILNRFIQPGARLLVLSRDGDTPAAAAALVSERGFGPSVLTVLEHLGSLEERVREGIAETWRHPRSADLNTLAIHCRAGPSARVLPPVPGLPDEAFIHDGKMTKREVRAAAIAALAPLPGQTLWDVGAGAGSIAIEWLRAVPRYRLAETGEARAFAIERNANRCAAIAKNAAGLGVPELEIIQGAVPGVLSSLTPQPSSVFLGGGVSQPGVLDTCWTALSSGGRLVAHAVTLEAAGCLFEFWGAHGGDLIRLGIARAGAVGPFTAFRAAMEVTQLTAIKP